VGQEILSCGFRDLSESAGQNVAAEIQRGEAREGRRLLQLRGKARLRTLSALKRLNMDQHLCDDFEE
jgi:hypothetical protein